MGGSIAEFRARAGCDAPYLALDDPLTGLSKPGEVPALHITRLDASLKILAAKAILPAACLGEQLGSGLTTVLGPGYAEFIPRGPSGTGGWLLEDVIHLAGSVHTRGLRAYLSKVGPDGRKAAVGFLVDLTKAGTFVAGTPMFGPNPVLFDTVAGLQGHTDGQILEHSLAIDELRLAALGDDGAFDDAKLKAVCNGLSHQEYRDRCRRAQWRLWSVTVAVHGGVSLDAVTAILCSGIKAAGVLRAALPTSHRHIPIISNVYDIVFSSAVATAA